MSVNEQNVTGRKYRVWDAANNIWKRLSFWTKASDVELNDGTNLENAISTINTNLTFDSLLETITFPSDGSILETFSDNSTKQTVFNSDGSISEIFTKGQDSMERKTIFNSNGSISIVEVTL